MNTLLFPGQGSQVVGMGSEFFKNFNLVKKIFKEADERLNYPISEMILEGPEDKLNFFRSFEFFSDILIFISHNLHQTNAFEPPLLSLQLHFHC